MHRFFTAAASAIFGIAAPTVVFAASALERLDKAANEAFPGQRERQAPEVAGQVINFFIGVLGILFLVLMVYGGYLWMNARGNEQQVDKAKSLITQAVLGLIIVLAGYAITYFVVTNLVNATGGVTTP
ncbi:hypothetical protein EPO33_04075 [Patescibacteria group bacterium]|nr:MAG: hypothetical protein EPO33_04075 [Patescibacteria group bacterium]